MPPIFDIHIHLPDPATLPRLAARGRKRLLLHLFLRGVSGPGPLTAESVEQYNRSVLAKIQESRLDRGVLLALDAPHREDGSRLDSDDAMVCRNDYLASLSRTGRKTLFGASVHPYRKDALKELEACIERGACLVKWLPSCQGIDPQHKLCLPFYEALAAAGVPLLCHTGCEHTLPGADNELNNPLRLRPALERGVTVIAAHCGARLLLHERSYFEEWRRLALDYERCYGDVSAFAVPTRLVLFARIMKDERLREKVLFGSDFPGFPELVGLACAAGVPAALRLRRERNPFDRAFLAFQELGAPDMLFSRAAALLRLPQPETAAA